MLGILFKSTKQGIADARQPDPAPCASSKTLKGEARLTETNISDAFARVRLPLLEADVALPVVKGFHRRQSKRPSARRSSGR